jgi:hypothetical protein
VPGLITFRIVRDTRRVGRALGSGVQPVLWIVAESAIVYACVARPSGSPHSADA